MHCGGTESSPLDVQASSPSDGPTLTWSAAASPLNVIVVPSYQSRSGVEQYNPPGSFRLGRTAQVKALQPAAMNRGIKATKTYTLRARRSRGHRVAGKLRVSFSFFALGPSIYQSYIYMCSSSVSFSAKEAS